MRLWLIAALFASLSASAGFAQEAPPARVGAVSYVSGNLAFHTAGDSQWSAARVNYPVATGGSFWTDPQARAQTQIGPSTISMAGGTELDMTNLDEQVAQLGLPQGRICLHLRQLDAGQSFEIDLPQGAVWLLQPGAYDINAGNPSQGARVAVFDGSARFVGSGVDLGVRGGDAVVLSQANPVAATTERADRDAFVEWCTAHDYHEARLAAPYYISAQMTGYADLDPYGSWQSTPEYGEVWYPNETPADWAPYRDGRWIWVAPWGGTWIDQQPWGFAPFHYGRWAYIGDRWGWAPGSYIARPVYAPALVAFVGVDAGIGAAAEAGPPVGWFPLAPGEAYWPSYTRNLDYIRNINATSVRNINTVIVASHGAPPPQIANAGFANRRFATVVPQRVFANADPVASAAVHVPAAALQRAEVSAHPPEIRPTAARAAAGPPGARATLGLNRPAPAGPGQSLHPRISSDHPGGPGASPANTAALPPHPGEVGHAGRGGPGPPPGEHGGPAAAARTEPGAAPNTAALSPHPEATSPQSARLAAHPATHAAARGSGAESARRGVPAAPRPGQRTATAAVLHSAPGPRPAAPAARGPVRAQAAHPPAVHPPAMVPVAAARHPQMAARPQSGPAPRPQPAHGGGGPGQGGHGQGGHDQGGHDKPGGGPH